MRLEYNEATAHEQLVYLSSLFDVKRMWTRLYPDQPPLRYTTHSNLTMEEIEVLKLLLAQASDVSANDAYNWIRPSLWSTVFKVSLAGVA